MSSIKTRQTEMSDEEESPSSINLTPEFPQKEITLPKEMEELAADPFTFGLNRQRSNTDNMSRRRSSICEESLLDPAVESLTKEVSINV